MAGHFSGRNPDRPLTRNWSEANLLASSSPSEAGDNNSGGSRHDSYMSHSGLMSSASSFVGGPGGGNFNYRHSSMSEKFSLSPSPAQWGTPLLIGDPEPDDALHNPDAQKDAKFDRRCSFSMRGFVNLGFLVVLILGLLMLFAGYPIYSRVRGINQSTQGGFNLGGINATGQIPELPGNFGLIDRDTPKEAYTIKGYKSGEELVLVFSDEFEQEGRTFHPGDDPYWEAADLHYWGTNDLEWYDPEQATTRNGSLEFTLEKVDDPTLNHNLNYKSGMVSVPNKFCFTGGLIEVSVRLPGNNNCPWVLAWRRPLAACTCPGEAHPGPMYKNGTYVGRSAPEIDIFEASIEKGHGIVSQSGQWAPFNACLQAQYAIFNTSGEVEFYNTSITEYNTYVGGVWQQTTSGVSVTNQQAYELDGGQFAKYGFEYKPGFDDAYITWVNDDKPAWTIYQSALRADPLTEISGRVISEEPMYIILNLGFSTNFATIDFDALTFPAKMAIDYVRVYQPKNSIRIGCDPDDHPTAAYIETYKEVYTNPNLTTWAQYGQPWPKNKLRNGPDGTCDGN
ncbi:beta-glucan synthesis-associated protein SKN1 [Ephemerocybe angulata]|uniref:Beta-glucan synthesis-associated protein SKN1 n=1 Tax=Ephemerocybe angulata TaxID=980116 RepID=A0A8H6IH07_9AGAR|nr:beta-glucan synthesis-associated protein SKN1 [Tulosesus angulatus]